MARWTIRRGMNWIAGIALVLTGYVGLVRSGGLGGLLTVPCCTFELSPTGQCARKEMNLLLGVLAYESRTGHFPTGTWPNPDLPPERRLSWYAAILPEIEYQEYSEALDRGQSWDAPVNSPVAGSRIALLDCPQGALPPPAGPVPTPYTGIAGLGADAPTLPKGHPRAGVFGYDRQTTLKDITDGASFTMIVAESGRVGGSWLQGGPATVRGLDPTDQPYLGAGRPFGGLHPRPGANVAFADGSVRFLSATIHPRLFEAFSTIAGGEGMPQDVFVISH